MLPPRSVLLVFSIFAYLSLIHSFSLPKAAFPKSRIESITVKNLAIVKDAQLKDLSSRLTVVTGETGAGKSLVTSAIGLACGDAASKDKSRQFNPDGGAFEDSFVTLTAQLHDEALIAVSKKLKLLSLDSAIPVLESTNTLTITRTIKRVGKNGNKIRSTCTLNSCPAHLKDLKLIVAPLIARIDANAAATVLSRSESRINAIDRGVEEKIMREAKSEYRKYRVGRSRRMKIERDLASSLPPSFKGMSMENDGDATTLRHWVEELNTFQEKWSLFRDNVVADIENNQDSSEPEFEADADNSPTAATSSALSIPSMMSLPQCAIELSKVNWEGGDGGWEAMLSLKNALVTHDKSYHAASEALMTLSSKSTLESAASSVEKTRDLLYDTASDQSSTVYDQSEKAHDLLNEVEATIQRCAEQIENRILNKLEASRPYVTLEELDELLVDWKSLARKHGISPEQVCGCHGGLRSELEGADENREKLPRAIIEESKALLKYQECCKLLTEDRKRVAEMLGEKVTELLPSLGMEAELIVDVRRKMGIEFGLEVKGGGLWGGKVEGDSVGIDVVDFLLLNNKATEAGKVEETASSGERARILLAIETCLPGSIGVGDYSGGISLNDFEFEDGGAEGLEKEEMEEEWTGLAKSTPISVLYDEIDSHVGGRAAVAVAKLLSNQGKSGSQIISITHNAAIASMADRHIVVEKKGDEADGVDVKVTSVIGSEREDEIARMAGGEMVSEEDSIAFSRALLKEGMEFREQTAAL
ncbi:hypothetical protein TrLO_g3585 [Triparma laevis f. longispina]|uniref:DNA repair protein RecN n=1 Tax=Triparma laevis f. longispina TaxID=1714387 RepID=A0A9W6ZJ42_9STRA|nr:hypothetical protein TrLO_g3585 [Triparma laevis f. longispina]